MNILLTLKFLGVMVDECLTFKNYVQYISKKKSRSGGILNKLKFYLPIEPLKYIYSAIILKYVKLRNRDLVCRI